jgi:ankyrin repeat protein
VPVDSLDKDGFTALHIACSNGHEDIVRYNNVFSNALNALWSHTV